VRKADNVPTSCAVVTKSGTLNFLEPSGPLQACNGTALPLPCTVPPPSPLVLTTARKLSALSSVKDCIVVYTVQLKCFHDWDDDGDVLLTVKY